MVATVWSMTAAFLRFMLRCYFASFLWKPNLELTGQRAGSKLMVVIPSTCWQDL
jgi:hypothetical protein